MCEKLTKIWWSRLIISVRGYVANYVQTSDEILFLTDDAFIMLHEKIVESSPNDSVQVTGLSSLLLVFFFFFLKQQQEKNTLIVICNLAVEVFGL